MSKKMIKKLDNMNLSMFMISEILHEGINFYYENYYLYIDLRKKSIELGYYNEDDGEFYILADLIYTTREPVYDGIFEEVIAQAKEYVQENFID